MYGGKIPAGSIGAAGAGLAATGAPPVMWLVTAALSLVALGALGLRARRIEMGAIH